MTWDLACLGREYARKVIRKCVMVEKGTWGKVQAGTAAKTMTDGFQSSWGTTKMRQRDIHDYFVPIQKQILN